MNLQENWMYKVKYYMGNTPVCKIFKDLSEATDFCIKRVPTGDVIEVVKVR